MTTLKSSSTAEEIFSILTDFIENKDINIDNILNKEKNLLNIFDLYYNKNNQQATINQHVANIIINNQNLIYNLVSLIKDKKADKNKLNPKIKESLELQFSIKSGSTRLEGLSFIHKILKLIPPDQRTVLVITLSVIGAICYNYNRIISEKHELQMQENKNKHELQIQEMDNKTKILTALINKDNKTNNEEIAETALLEDLIPQIYQKCNQKLNIDINNKDLENICNKYEKKNLTNLEKLDTDVTIYGGKYTKKQISTIREIRFPNKKDDKQNLDGEYKIKAIKISKGYIIIEDSNNSSYHVYYRDYYNKTNTTTTIEEIKESMQDSNTVFHIKATLNSKNKYYLESIDKINK